MVKCDRVLQELSNYIDEDVDSSLWAAIEEHVRGCHHCSVLVDSTRKMLYVLGDERVFEVPVGYCERLHERLAQHLARADLPLQNTKQFGSSFTVYRSKRSTRKLAKSEPEFNLS